MSPLIAFLLGRSSRKKLVSPRRRSLRIRFADPNSAVEILEHRDLLSGITVSLDAGAAPQVKEFDSTTLAENKNFLAFSNGFQGGVRVAMGDVNNDGTADIIAAGGPGGAPQVKVFDGVSGNEIRSFFAYSQNIFQGGLYVAAGDVNADGFDDIILGTGAGVRGNIRIFDGKTSAQLKSFTPFKKGFSGGVTVAVGDVNGDGRADLIAGTATNAAVVGVFDGLTGSRRAQFLPFSSAFAGGVTVAAGDVNGDGRDDLIIGTGANTRTTIRTFDFNTGAMLNSFEPFGTVTTGVRVGATDINGDGKADIIAGAGPGAAPHVKVFDGSTQAELKSFFAFAPSTTTGVFVAGDIPSIRNTAPVLTIPGTPVNTTPNTPAIVAPTGTVTDNDPYNYNGGILQVTIGRSSLQKNDSVFFGNGIQVQGSEVLVSGIVVGTFSGGTGTAPLRVQFNDKATVGVVQQILQAVAFKAGPDPSNKSVAGTRSIYFQVWDSGGLTSSYKIRNVVVA